MESNIVINKDNIDQYICKLINLSEGSKTAVNKFLDYWEGEDTPPFTSLFANIGTAIAHDFFMLDDVVRSEIFLLIELGMNSNDKYLATAVATGLVEALVNASDDSPELWNKIENCLGLESRSHALAWKNFGQ